MREVKFKFNEADEVKLKVDSAETKLMVVALHSQNGGNSYTVSNGEYTGLHCEYEICLFDMPKNGVKAGFRSKKLEE